MTVSVTPGRIIEAEPEVDPSGPDVQRNPTPRMDVNAYNWGNLAKAYGPLALLGGLLWFFVRRKGPQDEVNYGIYKGAMPLEMHTASHRHLVVTGRYAETSVFGKERDDYVPDAARVPIVPAATDGDPPTGERG